MADKRSTAMSPSGQLQPVRLSWWAIAGAAGRGIQIRGPGASGKTDEYLIFVDNTELCIRDGQGASVLEGICHLAVNNDSITINQRRAFRRYEVCPSTPLDMRIHSYPKRSNLAHRSTLRSSRASLMRAHGTA